MINSMEIRRKENLLLDGIPLMVICKSGMEVNILDNEWRILPSTSKGYLISVDWLHSSPMPDKDWRQLLEVFIHYLRTKAASTVSGVVCNSKPHLVNGFPDLAALKSKWSGLPTHQKKTINQVFGTLRKLGHKNFAGHHEFTKNHLDRESSNFLNPAKGALTELEFDQLAKLINNTLATIDWSQPANLSFYRTTVFRRICNAVASKLMIATVRRPIQLSLLKWCDLIPAGANFKNHDIEVMNEVGTLGASTLQLRVYHAKEAGSGPRSHPERYPLHLSEELSMTLLQYKKLYMRGVNLFLESCGFRVEQESLLHMASNMPIFPSLELFSWQVSCLNTFMSAFTSKSTLFHASDAQLTFRLTVPSDRATTCIVTNNRIRHTALTRGAQQGLPVAQLARITGVTIPAARHYIDMDYESRRMIDENYLGNEFLKQAFSASVTLAPEGQEIIVSHSFNEVGGVRNKPTCNTCVAKLGRPLGCYGCPNFRPFLEADHRAELDFAQSKLDINRRFLINPLETKSISRLETQIEWIKITIALCDDILLKQKAFDVK
ncbi:hypothetical protein [Halopseudomonas pelagia]|nr:hypothetical protein [Halopseudomonas pelagia]